MASSREYSIAWITALPLERSAAKEMLDEFHEEPTDFYRHASDQNTYEWGKIHNHCIVITSLAGYGKVNAAHAVGELLASLPFLKFGFMIGIGAGVRLNLGDVVIGTPNRNHGGVVQYDLGKAVDDWELKGFLNSPPVVLLNTVAAMQAEHESSLPKMLEFLNQALQRNRYWAKKFSRPSDGESVIHYGTIASGDTLLKNETIRDEIIRRVPDCICFEMEAAGILNRLPCIVIRGISDFGDSNKNDDWQRYSSAAAAACAKELLLYTPIQTVVSREEVAKVAEKKAIKEAKRAADLIRLLNVCPYAERKDRNPKALDGTCQWFLQHDRFKHWSTSSRALLWASADPGCGKSTLVRHLIDEVFTNDIVCYFFFKDDFEDQRDCARAIACVLRQLLEQRPDLVPLAIADFDKVGDDYIRSFHHLWSTFIKVTNEAGSVICLFDALDECVKVDRIKLIQNIIHHYKARPTSQLKFLLTSRPYQDIKDDFFEILLTCPTVHLGGENDEEVDSISKEIDLVIKHRIEILVQKRGLTNHERAYMVERFMGVPHRTYLWAHLTLFIIESAVGITKARLQQELASIPSSVGDAYEKMLNKSPNRERTKKLLQILMATSRPLSVMEASCAITMADDSSTGNLFDLVEPENSFRQTIRQLSGLVVVIVDNRVYFLHQTVREWLTDNLESLNDSQRPQHFWKISKDLVDAHRVLTLACQRFILADGGDSVSSDFFDYCIKVWPLHYRMIEYPGIDEAVAQMASDIFKRWKSGHPSTSGNVRTPSYRIPWQIEDYPIPIPLWAAWLDFPSVIKLWSNMFGHAASFKDIVDQALWWAVLGRNYLASEVLLELGADPNVSRMMRSSGMNALHIHPDPNAPKYGIQDISMLEITALGNAILQNNVKLVHLLLKYGADVQGAAIKGYRGSGPSPLTTVLGWRCLGFDIVYVAPYPGLDRTKPLIRSSANVKELVSLLTRYNADLSFKDEAGFVPLQMFLAGEHDYELDQENILQIIRLLRFPAFDVNQDLNGDGKSWLYYAANGAADKSMKVFLDMGASWRTDKKGNTILHAVAGISHRMWPTTIDNCLSMALQAGIDIDSRNCIGQTPLMAAALHGNRIAVSRILSAGADINAKDDHDANPLLYGSNFMVTEDGSAYSSPNSGTPATSFGEFDLSSKLEILNILINGGCNLIARDRYQNTALHLLLRSLYRKEPAIRMLDILVAKGVPINARNNLGHTPLILLVRIKSRLAIHRVLHHLLKHSVDVLIRDNDGMTALDWQRRFVTEIYPSITIDQMVDKSNYEERHYHEYRILSKLYEAEKYQKATEAIAKKSPLE